MTAEDSLLAAGVLAAIREAECFAGKLAGRRPSVLLEKLCQGLALCEALATGLPLAEILAASGAPTADPPVAQFTLTVLSGGAGDQR